ncbi:MAG: hypothetical protein IKG86_00705 [Paludibacteraceae bacterium]|nr:hypothetical protein [Paludibacteraceae bacterium]
MLNKVDWLKFGKWLYIVVWAICLFYATFPCVFDGTFTVKLSEDFNKNYLIPMIMVLELYLFDVIYSFHIASNEGAYSITKYVLICIALFFAAFMFTIYFKQDPIIFVISFIAAWLLLIILKIITTPTSKSVQIGVREIPD